MALIDNFIPMAGSIRSIRNIVAVAVAVRVLKATGMSSHTAGYRFVK
jgi:hypothetical protein